MDFSDSIEEAAFRAQAREWLHANYPSEVELQGLSEIERAKLWQKRKFEGGWACISWPREHGGRGATAIEQVIWDQEEAKICPANNLYVVGHGMCAPTLMLWAGEEHCQRYLPKLASGEEVWCQLFSEPAGGSDLAALRTSAERQGDDWVVNGQKIWTTYAQHSDYAILVVRTDTSVPKHQGLSYFFVDMKSPGIEVKPIKQISGDSGFNEVYLTNVLVPDSQRLGDVGQGWQVALTTLMNERAAIDEGVLLEVGFEDLFGLAKGVQLNNRPAIEDSSVRSRLADWYCQETALRFIGYRSMTALSKGEVPGPENSVVKLVGGAKMQDMAAFALDLLETSGGLWNPDSSQDHLGIYQKVYLTSPGVRIAGGTDEILTNIIAERVLGMPQELRVDKGIPFSEVPTSGR